MEPDRAWRTRGLGSRSLILVMLLEFKRSTTLGGGRGWDAAVPQLKPMAVAGEKLRAERLMKKKKRMRQRFGGITAEREMWNVTERRGF